MFGRPSPRVVRGMNAAEAFRLSSRAYSTLLREVSIWDKLFQSKSLGFDMQLQTQSNWCWAATATSVSHYYWWFSPWVQCTVANAELGRNDACNNPPDAIRVQSPGKLPLEAGVMAVKSRASIARKPTYSLCFQPNSRSALAQLKKLWLPESSPLIGTSGKYVAASVRLGVSIVVSGAVM